MTYVLPSSQEKHAYVRRMFDGIARRYDLLNDVMTGGLHRLWKRFVVRQAAVGPGAHVLDACTGTGDIALRLAKAVAPNGKVVGLDFSRAMLDVARQRPTDGLPLSFVEGDFMSLPFEAASFDAVTVGYGLRNVPSIPAALGEVLRVLKPGGKFVSLDLGKPTVPLFREAFYLFFRHVVPVMGRLIAGSGEAYTYLPASLRDFPAQEGVRLLMSEAGFTDVRVYSLAGGAAAVHVGTKP